MDLGSTQSKRSTSFIASTIARVWLWVVIATLLALAVLGNLYVVPGDHIVTGLFAIEILLSALWFGVGEILVISVSALALYLVTSIVDHQPFLVALLGFSGLVIVGYLAIELARERVREYARSQELLQAYEQLRLSEERLHVGLSLADVSVYNQDTNLRYTAVFNPNPHLQKIESVIGKTDRDIMNPDQAESLASLKRQVIETGLGIRQDLSLTVGGVTRVYDMRIEPLRDRTGRIIGITGSSTDITERQKSEEARFFEATILANIRDSVIATDLGGNVTYWNRGAQALFGYAPEEVLQHPLFILSEEEDPTRIAAHRDRLLAGEEFSGEILERRKDGEPVWVDLKIAVLRSSTDEPIGFLRVASDITDRKRLEIEREELLRREQLALRQLQQFVALVAHDLDQPLTTIHGVTQLLERGMGHQIGESEHRRLRSIRQATQRMSRLTSDLRQAIAIGSGHFTVNPQPVDFMHTVRSVVNEQQQSATDHRIVLSCPDHLSGEWDPDRIVQLLSNLISNAVKYSPEGGEIHVDVAADMDEVVTSVTDSGIGMTGDQVRQIFEPFSRVHENLRASGSGLGLYISKGIVEAHGGRIDVRSEPGLGSTFTVRLPLRGVVQGE